MQKQQDIASGHRRAGIHLERAPSRRFDYPNRAKLARRFHRAINARAVNDQDLRIGQASLRGSNAAPDHRLLVERGDDHRKPEELLSICGR